MCFLCSGLSSSTAGGFSSDAISSTIADDGRFAAGPGLVASYTPPTGNAFIDGVLWGYKWPTTALTYAFPSAAGAFQYSLQGFGQFTQAAQAATIASLKMYSDVSLLTFTAAADPATANIRSGYATGIDYTGGTNFQPPAGTAGTAEANPPDPEFNQRQWGDNWYNPNDFNNPKLGDYAFLTIVHELGHSLGLKHGHSTQTVTNQPGVLLPTLPTDRDSIEFSVMTYRSFIGAATNGGFSNETFGYPQSLMMADIAALQYMYGANYGATANNTNTVYGFDPNTGVMSVNGVAQQAPGDGAGGAQNRIFRTIWDGGGIDTYDLSNYATNQLIDLRPGQWSKFSDAQLANLGTDAQNVPQMARANVFNALLFNGNVASLIENANGGSGNDTVTGNEANNHLQGMGGVDVLDGGLGSDTLDGGLGVDEASYAGDTLAVAANLLGGFAVQRVGQPDFTVDTLTGIENLRGGAGDDFLLGDNNANRLEGLGGGDNLWGFAGADTLIGGEGNDIIVGGDNDDSLESGLGQDWLYGQGGADTLRATDATANAFNVLVGGDGNDTLIGGPTGFDYFYGGDGATGGGNDSFVIAANSGFKVMNDFEAGGVNDVVRLAGTAITSYAQAQGAMSFSGTINGTVLVVDGATQVWFLGLAPGQLTAADFLFA